MFNTVENSLKTVNNFVVYLQIVAGLFFGKNLEFDNLGVWQD